MKIIKFTLIFALLINLNGLYADIDKSLVERRPVLDISDFEFVRENVSNGEKREKALYKRKSDGRFWLINKHMTIESLRQYFIGDFYTLVLGPERSPHFHLVRNEENHLLVGSPYVKGFKSLLDFFLPARNCREEPVLELLKRCYPTGCTLQNECHQNLYGGSIGIEGAEEILALMIFLGDIDGNCANLGLVPSPTEPGVFLAAKVDHDDIGAGYANIVTLRSMAKFVFGEGKSYFTEIDYEHFDSSKLAGAFQRIARIDDETFTNFFVNRYLDFYMDSIETGMSEFLDPQISEFIEMNLQPALDLLLERKKQCLGFAIGAFCEGAIRNNDFKAIKDMVDAGFDVNIPVEFIYLDTAQNKQVESLVKLWYRLSTGELEDPTLLIEYLQQNEPITVLEMAVRYGRNDLAKKLFALSNKDSISAAQEAAHETNNKEMKSFFRKHKQKVDL